jgi:hypothetical protein
MYFIKLIYNTFRKRLQSKPRQSYGNSKLYLTIRLDYIYIIRYLLD